MKSPDQLVAFVARGYDVQVERQDNNRVVKVVKDRGRERASIKLAADDYEAFMADAMAQIAAGDGRSFTVDIKRDFYGGMRAEVRSGLFGTNVSRLLISPRHLALLNNYIELQKARVREAG